MAIRIASFAGEIPRLIPRLLNDNYAQIAQNTKLEQGNLLPIRRGRFVTKLTAAAKTIYRHGNDWLSWSSAVDAVPGPVASDRLYVTGDGAPKVRFNGSFYPLALARPSAAAHAATSSTVDDANSFTVIYSYTWVTALDEESEPADLSNELLVDTASTVTLTGFSAPPAGRQVDRMRIYRSQTSALGNTSLYFIAERAAGTGAFSDTIQSNPIQEVIPSADFNPPPDDLQGLTSLPNGMMAAFTGKKLYFCEPYMPHAWPEKYVLTLDYEIVGLGAFGSSVAIMTKGCPYVAQGTAPENMTSERLEVNHPCLSALGIVDLGYAVAYPAPQGLVTISQNGAQVVSETVFTMDQWRAMQPESFIAGQFAGRYMASYHYQDDAGTEREGIMMMDLSGSQPFLLRSSDSADAMFFEVGTGKLFLLRNGVDIYEWDAISEDYGELLWRSKKFVTNTFSMFTCLLVEGDPSLTAVQLQEIATKNAARRKRNRAMLASGQTGGSIAEVAIGRTAIGASLLDPVDDVDITFSVTLYGDGNAIWTGYEMNKIMRLPGVRQYRTWEIEIRSNQSITALVLAYSPTEIAEG